MAEAAENRDPDLPINPNPVKFRAFQIFVGLAIAINFTYLVIFFLFRFSLDLALVILIAYIKLSGQPIEIEIPTLFYSLPKTVALIATVFGVSLFLVLSLTQYKKKLKSFLYQDEGLGKLSLEDIFQNQHRALIIETILEHPGIHFSELQTISELVQGNLQYHIQTLERYRIIRSEQVGQYKVFFARLENNPLRGVNLEFMKSETTFRVYEYIHNHPGTHLKSIARYLGKSKATISYHVKKMTENHILRTEEEGTAKRLFVNNLDEVDFQRLQEHFGDLDSEPIQNLSLNE